MENLHKLFNDNILIEKSINAIIKFGIILFVIVWCYFLLAPFLMIGLWGLILAASVYPFFQWLKKVLWGKRIPAAVVVTAVLLALFLVPTILLGDTLIGGLIYIRDGLQTGKQLIPRASENLKNWPLVGNAIYQTWNSGADNFHVLITEHKEQITSFLMDLLKSAGLAGLTFLKFLISIVLSGVFLTVSDSAGKFIEEIVQKLASNRGMDFVKAAIQTIRSVARGILGVAVIQSSLAGISFLIVGVPAAGLWAFAALILCIIQIGITPVLIGVVIWVFMKASTLTAILFLLWSILLAVSDNVLKPLLLGRGSKSPMLVIFLGAIGGFLYSGLIGLFTGAVILSLGYELFLIWLRELKAEPVIEP
jgi:predicted PurR-regulated permease PerM